MNEKKPPTKPPADTDDGRTIIAPTDRTVTAPTDAPGTPFDADRTIIDSARHGQTTNTSVRSVASNLHEVPEAVRNTSVQPGTIINNLYRIEERLDQGGMGRVYRGTEIHTGANVAIKVILPEMAEDDKVAKMFVREAVTLRELNNDAIVRYFAYVPPSETLAVHSLVMDFISGTKLSEHLKSHGPLSERDFVKLTARLAGGLTHAHDAGTIHRDLSPDNVMLPGGDIAKAVIIDFGISRSSKLKDATIGNEFAGKLKYVSPEQLGAFGGEADARSDIYTLGLLMVAMLIGHPMPMGATIVEAVELRQTVPDLSSVPHKFQGLIYQMLQPDPANRMPSMGEVLQALRDAADGSVTFTALPTSNVSSPPPSHRVSGLQTAPIGTVVPLSGSPTAATERHPEVPSRGSWMTPVILLALMCIALGSGFVAWQQFAQDPEEVVPSQDDTILRVPGTRETFLAEALSARCAYATRREKGMLAGMIEGFSGRAGLPADLSEQYDQRFNAAPQIVERNVNQAQCAALEFAHTLQGTQSPGIELALRQSELSPEDNDMIGYLHGSGNRENWLALIDPGGRVFSLSSQFSEPLGNERQFSFSLSNADPGPYIILATASQEALVRVTAIGSGADATRALPLLLNDLARSGEGASDIAFFEVVSGSSQ